MLIIFIEEINTCKFYPSPVIDPYRSISNCDNILMVNVLRFYFCARKASHLFGSDNRKRESRIIIIRFYSIIEALHFVLGVTVGWCICAWLLCVMVNTRY